MIVEQPAYCGRCMKHYKIIFEKGNVETVVKCPLCDAIMEIVYIKPDTEVRVEE